MKLLLDTQSLLWWMSGDKRLGRTARSLIEDPDHEKLVSQVSLWEIVVKVRLGKLAATLSEIEEAIAADGFSRINLESTHLRILADLPSYRDHRDPFDHLLFAQAIAETATLMSSDHHAPRYPLTLVLPSA